MASRNTTSHSHSYDFDIDSTTNETRNCKEDALTEREFERYFEATYDMDTLKGLQSRFIAICAGRLGLRAGEIVHMQEDWINWTKSRIEIPGWEQCQTGRDGSICALCHRLADQKRRIATANIVDHVYHELADADDAVLEPGGGRVHGIDLPSHERMLETMWSPKTDAAVRGVPFDYDARNENIIEQFFDYYDEFPRSYQALRRRVADTTELTPGLDPDDMYAHALRSTAASFHAGRGLDVVALKRMFGWENLSTAQKYLAGSDRNVQRALHATHSR